MRPVTYRQLLDALNELSEEQLDMTVLVLNQDNELSPLEDYQVASWVDCYEEELLDVVDEEQPLLII